MSQPLSLEKTIKRQTLSRTLALLLVLTLLMVTVAGYIIKQEVEQEHRKQTDLFVAGLDKAVRSLQQQVRSLANNDLIINSLIDYSNRETYLPVFFRSLEFTVTEDIAIAFTDYTGQVITGKNLPQFARSQSYFNWPQASLQSAEDFLDYSDKGVLISSPVLYSNSSEGAIVVHVSSLQPFIEHINDRQLLLVVSASGIVLYSSDPATVKPLDHFQVDNYRGWYHRTQPFGSASVVSLESLGSAYSNIIWLGAFLLMAIFAVILGALYSTRTAAWLAADTLGKLERELEQRSRGEAVERQLDWQEREPKELTDIRLAFDQLLENLATTSISRDRFEGVINSLDEMLLVVDLSQNILLVNDSFLSFLDATGFQLDGDMSRIVPENYFAFQSASVATVERSYPFSGTAAVDIQRACTIRWFRSLYRNDEGELIGFVIVGDDISEEKQLQKELHLKSRAVDEANTSILIADAQQQGFPITYVNAAFEKVTGYNRSEILGRSCSILQGPGTDALALEMIRAALRSSTAATVTLLNYRKDGTSFYNELTLNPIINEEGITTHILGLQKDVTEREFSARYLHKAKQKAEESAQMKSDFLASMSHEIRTPVNGVTGMLRMLLDSKLTSEQRHHAELAQSSAESLLSIINDVLDFSKIEAGKLEIENIDYDLLQALSLLLKSFAGKAEEKGLQLVLDCSAISVRVIKGDPGRLRQILTNLIGNAIKFTEQGSVLVVASLEDISAGRKRLHCSVKDTGVGIAPDLQAHIFESFTQADTSTTRKFGGTGLGLAISRQLCQLMGGEIAVQSEVGLGSQFSFSIELEYEGAGVPLPAPPPGLRQQRVLVVDDSVVARAAVAAQLRCWDFEVCFAATAELARQQLQQQAFDIAFIDSNLLHEGGVDWLEKIRTNSLAPRQCALILMAEIQQRDDQQLSQRGLCYSFPKPATIFDLVNALNAVAGVHTSPEAGAGGNATDITQAPLAAAVEPVSPCQVLVVEDNRTNRLVAEALLSRLGLSFRVAENGLQALQALTDSNFPGGFGLILMDCQMPIMDGFEATRRIRSGEGGEHYASVPIVAMTANAMQGDRERCLNAGMSDYISKPIDAGEFRRKLSQWLGPVVVEETNSGAGAAPKEGAVVDAGEVNELNWKRDELLARLMGNEDLLAKVLRSYLGEIPPLIEQIPACVEARDFERIRYFAHTVKGASENIAALALGNFAQQMETAARQQDAACVDEVWPLLASSAEGLFKSLQRELSRVGLIQTDS